MAIADLNGDGLSDLLVSTNSGVSVLYGATGGTFKPAVTLSTGTSYAFIATGDFNKNGKVDIALSDANAGEVFILLNQGGGAFSSPVGYTIGFEPGSFYVEDFDGDGSLDLVFAAGHPDALTPQQYSEVIDVLFGNGDGTFVGAATYPGAKNTGSVAVTADFNGDGILDIATASTVLLGKGKGQFATPAALPLTFAGGPIFPQFVAAGDLNGDGKPDLVFTDSAGFIDVLLNNGNGAFAAPARTSSTALQAGAIALGDFNNDKKLDLAVALPNSNNVAILLGNRDGTFQSPVNVPVGHNPMAIVAADLNGDGKVDLVVTDAGTAFSSADPGGITVLISGNGNGTFQVNSYTAAQNPASVSVGDFNGDGKLDLIVPAEATDFATSFKYTLVEFIGNGNGTFQPGRIIPTDPSDFGLTQAMVADFNGDGKQDLVVLQCCGDTDFTFLLGNGDGTFQPEVIFVSGSASSGAVADFNGDGKPDLAIASGQFGAAASTSSLLNVTPAASSNAPAVTPGGVVSAAAFGGFPMVAPGSWMEIYGTNLAPDTRPWAVSDFVGNAAPSSLDGVKVTIGGQLAFIDYISPTQVNAQVPSNIAAGTTQLTVTTPTGTSTGYPITVNSAEPGLLAPSTFNIGGRQYVVATFLNGEFVLPPGSLAGVTTRQAKPGETIILYGVGFGAVTPVIPAGQIVTQLNQLAAPFQVNFGSAQATVTYDGLATTAVGLYQFNVTVPTIADSDAVP